MLLHVAHSPHINIQGIVQYGSCQLPAIKLNALLGVKHIIRTETTQNVKYLFVNKTPQDSPQNAANYEA